MKEIFLKRLAYLSDRMSFIIGYDGHNRELDIEFHELSKEKNELLKKLKELND